MIRTCGIATLVLLVCLGCWGWLAAQGTVIDAVERLRQTLRMSPTDAGERDRMIGARLAVLGTPQQLRQAYTLPEWSARSSDSAVAEVDRANRTALGQRFVQATRELLQGNDAAAAAAAV